MFGGFHSAAARGVFRAAAATDPAAALPHCAVALALDPGGNWAALVDDVAATPYTASRPADALAATTGRVRVRRLAAAAVAALPVSPLASYDAD